MFNNYGHLCMDFARNSKNVVILNEYLYLFLQSSITYCSLQSWNIYYWDIKSKFYNKSTYFSQWLWYPLFAADFYHTRILHPQYRLHLLFISSRSLTNTNITRSNRCQCDIEAMIGTSFLRMVGCFKCINGSRRNHEIS